VLFAGIMGISRIQSACPADGHITKKPGQCPGFCIYLTF
jgi:hypothetical protein